VLSCPDAIAKAMEESIVKNEQPISPKAVRRCPICNRILRRESNCEVCECGFTKCG
jgi:hypothetical protein